MKRRIAIFVTVFAAMLALAYFYVAERLASSAGGMVAISIPFIYTLAASIGLRQMLSASGSGLARAALWANSLSMGWISFALLFTAARDVIFFLPSTLGWIDPAIVFGPRANAETVAASLLALAWGCYGGLRLPRAREVEARIAGLPAELDGFAIAQISDLHIGPTIREAFVRGVVERANALNADAVALTGDIVDGACQALKQEAAPLAELEPRGRVFYVPGNHEYYWDSEAWFALFRGYGFRVLLNSGAEIQRLATTAPATGPDGRKTQPDAGRKMEPEAGRKMEPEARVWIGGIVDPAARMRGSAGAAPDLAASLSADGAAADGSGGRAAGAALKVLLAHQPTAGAEAAAAAGYDAQVSGHTHGGQFFPWTLVVGWVQRFPLGIYRVGKMWLYVSPGTGSWGPPVRLGTRTEITKIVFRASEGAPRAGKAPASAAKP
jgi:predicted MPP superfamily phosphohydrolase